jgi:hypothetical protein
MADQADSPQKPFKPPGTTAQKTDKGPHGGGTKFVEQSLGKGFIAIPPIKGHSQKQNINKDAGKKQG